MSGAMRVLHVIASLSPFHGGTTSAVLQMIAGLEASGIACEVAASDDDGPGRRLLDDAPERKLPGRHFFRKLRDLYVYTPTMGPWLDAHVARYDLVHIHGLFSHVNGLAGRICRRRGVPYVVTPHGMANRYGVRHKPVRKAISLALVERPLLEGAEMVHMTSRGEERDFADLKINTPVVRIPLSVAAVQPGDGVGFRARHKDIGDRRIAVFIGRLNPIKNLEAAIEALAFECGTGFHLVICGEGPADYTAKLKEYAEKLGVAARISWLGFVSGQDKTDVLAAGEVYIQPSHSESFGIAAVEAVSAGLPCVLGENVGIAEDLVEAGYAVTVQPTGKSVSEGIGKAVALANKTPEFAARASDFVSANFAAYSISAQLRTQYNRICDRGLRFVA